MSLSRDFIDCNARVKFVNSNWSVPIRLLLVKLSRSVRDPFVGLVYVVNKSFLRCEKLLTTVE